MKPLGCKCAFLHFVSVAFPPRSVTPQICQPPTRRPRQALWIVPKMPVACPSRGDKFLSAQSTTCKTEPARWGMEAAGASCPACPHSPCSSSRLPWALAPCSKSPGASVSVQHGDADVGKRKEEMEQAGEGSRRRRMSTVQAESGQWGCQPFG